MSKRFLPLAITLAEDEHACVAGVDESDAWVRPEPILASEVTALDTPYHCFTWIEAELGPPEGAEPRIEDRRLLGKPSLIKALTNAERVEVLGRHLDAGVEQVFAGERTLGLVRARVDRIYVWEWVRRQVFLRIAFHEPSSGASYDWLLPDYRIGRACFSDDRDIPTAKRRAERISEALRAAESMLAISLTRPNARFPGKFRGCHPLVVAIHGDMDIEAALKNSTV